MLIVNYLFTEPKTKFYELFWVFFIFQTEIIYQRKKQFFNINNDLTDDATECYGAARIMKYCGFFSGKHRYKRLTYTRMHKSVHMCTVY